MVHQYRPSFPHRINRNGAYDSICTLCHLTVASAKIEAELSHYEKSHKCSPIRIFEVSEYTRTSGAIAVSE